MGYFFIYGNIVLPNQTEIASELKWREGQTEFMVVVNLHRHSFWRNNYYLSGKLVHSKTVNSS